MTEVRLRKDMDGALRPAFPTDEEIVEKWAVKSVIKADCKKPRNQKFHNKFFALLELGYDGWEPRFDEENPQVPADKNFDVFRKEVVMLAGYYDWVISVRNGNSCKMAKSISFAKMDETEFAELYDKVCDVLIKLVLTNYTRDDIDEQVERLMGFVS